MQGAEINVAQQIFAANCRINQDLKSLPTKRRLKDTLVSQDVKKRKQDALRLRIKLRRAKIIAARRLKETFSVSHHAVATLSSWNSLNKTSLSKIPQKTEQHYAPLNRSDWATYVKNLDSPDSNIRRETLRTLKMALCSNISPPTLDFVLMHNEMLPHLLLKHLQNQNDKLCQIEAAWCIASLCCASHKTYLKLYDPPVFSMQNQNIIPERKDSNSWEQSLFRETPLSKMFFIVPYLNHLVQYSSRSTEYITLGKQALYSLCNIAADSRSTRMFLLRQGLVPILLENMYRNSPLVCEAVKCLGCLVRRMRNQDDFVRQGCLDRVVSLLMAQVQKYIISPKPEDQLKNSLILDLLWITSFLTSGDSTIDLEGYIVRIYDIITTILGRIGSQDFHIPCLRILGNILRTSSNQIHKLICQDHSLLHFSHSALRENIFDTKVKDILFFLSNFSAGPDVCARVLMEVGIAQTILEIAQHELISFETKREAMFSMTNICASGYIQRIMFEWGGFKAFMLLLRDAHQSPELLYLQLNFLRFLLENAASNARYIQELFIQFGGISYLQTFSSHSDTDIASLSCGLLTSIQRYTENDC